MTSRGFEAPGQEARALIEAVGGISLARQLADPKQTMEPITASSLEEALLSRLRRIPLSQIVGRAWFRGLPFKVNRWTLSPRPETEHLVEAAILELAMLEIDDAPLRILDTFTGTGAVGISLAAYLKDKKRPFKLVLVDQSGEALRIAAENAANLLPDQPVSLVEADIWPGTAEPFDLILANPPYIPTGEIADLMPEVALHEPAGALDGGPDGLDFYRRLAREGLDYLADGGLMILELGAGQADAVAKVFFELGWLEEGRGKDYLGHERVIRFSIKSHVK